MAYWRALIPKEVPSDHPAEGLPRLKETLQDPHKTITGQQMLAYWRLELGSLAPALDNFLKTQAENASSENINDLEWWNNVLAADRELLFPAEAVEDHRMRLLDLAYVMHLKGEPGVGEVLAIADDLGDRKHESAYAKSMTTKTFLLLFETIRRQNAPERSEGIGGRP
jgi:hypothetical protein